MTSLRRRRTLLGIALMALIASIPGLPASPAAAVAPAWTPGPPLDQCPSLDAYSVADNGRFRACFDYALGSAWLKGRTHASGIHLVDGGSAEPPGPLDCVAGKAFRADGWQWNCVLKGGQPVLVKTKPWAQPVEFAFQHTSSHSRSTVTLTANMPMTGCVVSTSDKRLVPGGTARLSGRSARLTLDTSTVPAGKYRLSTKCGNRLLSSSTDVLVRGDGSALLRSDCLDAWHDGKYGDAVPGYGRRMSPRTAEATVSECRKLTPLTMVELARAGREAYVKIGQIAEREVRRVSAERGIPICQAIGEVFKPVDTAGNRVEPWPLPYLDAPRPTAGYLPDGFFPILYDEWTGGPVAMQSLADCTTGNQALQLNAGFVTCDSSGGGSATGNSQDPHQMYPFYVLSDRATCPFRIDLKDINPNIVCIVWGDRIGNNTIGGVGRVFVGEAVHEANPFDCQDRALKSGQFVNVDVDFAPPLR